MDAGADQLQGLEVGPVKLGIDHREHIMRRWGRDFPPGEKITAAELVMRKGHIGRGVAWSLPEAVVNPLGDVVQEAASQVGKVGEEATAEWARGRGHEQQGEAKAFPKAPVVLVVTNRRYLLFAVIRSGFKQWFDPIASHGPTWVTKVDVEGRAMTHRLRLTFHDGTSVRLEMTRGLTDVHALASAIRDLVASGPA
jgi:hypothetical protein